MTVDVGSIEPPSDSGRPSSRPLARLIALIVAVTTALTLAGVVLDPAVARTAEDGDGPRRSCREVAARWAAFVEDLERRIAPGGAGIPERTVVRSPDPRDLTVCRLLPTPAGGRGDVAESGRPPAAAANPSRPPAGAPPRTESGPPAANVSGLDPLILAAVLVLVVAGTTRVVVVGTRTGGRHEKRRRVDRLCSATVALLRSSASPPLWLAVRGGLGRALRRAPPGEEGGAGVPGHVCAGPDEEPRRPPDRDCCGTAR